MKPFTRKRPTGIGSFTYARVVDKPGVVLYRMCRRDGHGAHHYVQCAFAVEAPRAHIATELNIARHQLRNSVDDVDLALMGVV